MKVATAILMGITSFPGVIPTTDG